MYSPLNSHRALVAHITFLHLALLLAVALNVVPVLCQLNVEISTHYSQRGPDIGFPFVFYEHGWTSIVGLDYVNWAKLLLNIMVFAPPIYGTLSLLLGRFSKGGRINSLTKWEEYAQQLQVTGWALTWLIISAAFWRIAQSAESYFQLPSHF